MLEHRIFRDPQPGQPRVLAAFSYRHDAHLVPDLIENLRPGIHGYVAWDDRAADRALSDEPTRRIALVRAGRDLGADWLLTADPDERFEVGIADWLPELLAHGDRILWHFQVREMFSPTQYRVDGLWSSRPRLRLFPASVASVDPGVALHGSWVADEAGLMRRTSGLDLYHLRMATPERRRLRRELYAAADPERRFQPIGYDYLTDERGMVLETIPEGRGFLPAFVEDHGLWSPNPGDLGTIRPDPYATRFIRAAVSARQQGQAAARLVMDDLQRDSPQDSDLRHLAGRFALLSGDAAGAVAVADDLLRTDPDDLSARLLRAEGSVARGDGMTADLIALRDRLPDNPVVATLCADANRKTADFAAREAFWRRSAPPEAVLHEGNRIATSDLAVVVIGFRNQPGLLPAVRSLLAQEAEAEIVVVNSGGGDVKGQLATVLDRIRLITTDRPCHVGVARTIGIEASRARLVAFLAGDCLAGPGWVSGRLGRHCGGALTVSSAVVTEDGAGLLAVAANRLRYAARHPMAQPRDVSHYGQSYDRRLLRRCGQFPPGLQSAEDTRLNQVTRRFASPVWAPDVRTAHREPPSLRAWLQDEVARGRRQTVHPPLRALAALDADPRDLGPALDRIAAFRLRLVRRLVSSEPGPTSAERRAILATQWLAALATRRGTLAGLAEIAAANRLAAEADASAERPDLALALLLEARKLDPQDPAKAVQAGKLLLQLGRIPDAEAALADALALAPFNAEAAELLTGLVAARDGAGAALTRAETLALAAPTSAALWSVAAGRARAAGQVSWAVALGRIALACAVDRPALHADLARHHLAAGDHVLAAFRSMTARRLPV